MINFKLIFISILLSLSVNSFSQVSNTLNAETPNEVGELTSDQEKYNNDKPLPYGYVGDRDVLWSKTVWETIDLNQKVNFPLLFPTDSRNFGKNRRSLFQVLIDGIEEGTKQEPDNTAITEVYSDSYFNQKKDFEQIQSNLKAIFFPDVALEILGKYGVTGTDAVEKFKQRALANTLDDYPNLYPPKLVSEMDPFLVPSEITGDDIDQYLIKGIYYVDKRQGELKYRLLGIAPAGYDIQTQNPSFTGNRSVTPFFWIWYADARNALYEASVLNSDNGAKPLNFDQLLTARRFDAKIYKTENIYEDREIDDYVQNNAMMQLLESNRIKQKIRNFELDLWTY